MSTLISAALVEGLGVADVVDALMQRYGHRAHLIDLVSPDPSRVLFGPAVTVGFLPVRQDLMDPQRHSLGPAFYRAIEEVEPRGHVLVMASNGHPHASLGGGTKLSRLRNHEMAGVLCDGHLRDFEELLTYDVGVYCRGETVRAGGNEIQPYIAAQPVVLDGITVVPGDYVFARGGAAVVIPAADVVPVLERARMIMTAMDEAKAGMVGEDPQQILERGSDEL